MKKLGPMLVILFLAACGAANNNVGALAPSSSGSPVASPSPSARPTPSHSQTPTPATSTSLPASSPTPPPSSPPATSPPAQQVSGTTSAAPLPDCTDSQLHVTVATSKAHYTRGTAIPMTQTVKNTSTTPCHTSGSICADGVHVTNSGGTTVWSSTMPGAAMCVRPSDYYLMPGGTVTYNFSWDQYTCERGSGCPGAQVPDGTYRLHGGWNDIEATPVAFSIG